MKGKTLQQQIMEIKFQTASLLSYQVGRLTIAERNAINELYELMDNVLLDNIQSSRYTMEEYVDAALIEHSIILSASKNSAVKKLGKLVGKGIKW